MPPASAPATAGGYEGWWNGTPASGDMAGLPQENVAVSTATNKVIESFRVDVNGFPLR
ncbi:hypothetical protein [Arthrobacter sp. UYCu712]|uniref:hypothetical protein n=1 Tax=Arthrobacter sp. UYCu712 TaxID=3156340 RepID=UPI003398BFC6